MESKISERDMWDVRTMTEKDSKTGCRGSDISGIAEIIEAGNKGK